MKRPKQERWESSQPERSNPFGEFFREELGYEGAEKSPVSSPGGEPNTGKSATSSRYKGQRAVLSIERKGRGGKTVTLVKGLQLSPTDRETLARELRQACGAGGTVDGDTLEIQGDQRPRAAEYLESLGIKVKR